MQLLEVPNTATRARVRKRWWLLLALSGSVAVAIAILSDRVPADPTVPLELQQPDLCQPLARKTVRVGTFNIRGGEGLDDRVDLDRTAKTLADLDLVALQEVHGSWPGFGNDTASVVGEKLSMSALFVPSERRWGRDDFGNGLLTRVPLTGLHRVVLQSTQRKKFRNAILSTFELDGQTVRVVMTHIDRVRDHDRQLREVFDLFLQLQSPALLMGDLNTFPDNPDLKALLARPEVTDYVGDEGSENRGRDYAVDWIILRGLKCVSHECRDLNASDHPAVCAELELVSPRR